jgi:glycerol-3-phosphate cytidylyltransferase
MILCHRGMSDYFPENTIGSILETFKNSKYDGIEIDIQLTKDNKWIIYHDNSLLRLNGLNKEVSKTDYSDINSITWKGNSFPVNLLSELNQISFNRKFILNIEIKPKCSEVNDYSKNKLYKTILSIRTPNFVSSFDHDWFDWFAENTNIDFACISEKNIPSKGSFWILDEKLFEKIDLIDIMEKNIKIGSYGNNSNLEPVDESSPLKYQIVDHKKKKVVYVDGAFDLLHSGHIDFFKKAKNYGDILIVGVLDDSCVESYKRKPILSLKDRTIILENLRIVDKVISPAPFYNTMFGNLDREFLQTNNIDKVVYAGELGEWTKHYKDAIDMDMMVNFPYGKENLSTTHIIERIKFR